MILDTTSLNHHTSLKRFQKKKTLFHNLQVWTMYYLWLWPTYHVYVFCQAPKMQVRTTCEQIVTSFLYNCGEKEIFFKERNYLNYSDQFSTDKASGG